MTWSFAATDPHKSITGIDILDGTPDALRTMRYQFPEYVDKVALLSGQIQMGHGYVVVAADAPKRLCWRSTNRAVPDMFCLGAVPIVSERLRASIEEHESGAHQFLPVDLYRPKSNEPFARYFWLSICLRLDPVDGGASSGIVFQGNRSLGVGYWRVQVDGSSRLAFSTRKIGVSHLWRDIYLSLAQIYTSETFHLALIERGMTGWSGKQFEQV